MDPANTTYNRVDAEPKGKRGGEKKTLALAVGSVRMRPRRGSWTTSKMRTRSGHTNAVIHQKARSSLSVQKASLLGEKGRPFWGDFQRRPSEAYSVHFGKEGSRRRPHVTLILKRGKLGEKDQHEMRDSKTRRKLTGDRNDK